MNGPITFGKIWLLIGSDIYVKNCTEGIEKMKYILYIRYK